MQKKLLLYLLMLPIMAASQQLTITSAPQLYMPGTVSTPAAEVKITFSPDGKKALWGTIDRNPTKKDLDIWEMDQHNGKW